MRPQDPGALPPVLPSSAVHDDFLLLPSSLPLVAKGLPSCQLCNERCPWEMMTLRVTLRNPGSSGRKECPEAGTGSWLGRTRNQVINSLPDDFHPGTDFCGIPWIVIIIVFLGISTLAIFLWKTSLCVSFLKTVLKSQNVHDGSKDVQRKAWRSNSRSREGIKFGREDLFTSWRHMEAKVRAEVRKVTGKVNSHYKINGQRKTAEEEKQNMKECEQAENERQLSEAEENGKLDMKEIHTQLQPFQRTQELQRWAEDYYRCKITPSVRKPLANSGSLFVFLAFGHSLPGQDMDVFFSPHLCAQALQRWMAERKAAYKQHRCEMRQKQRVPERHMSQEPVQGRPGLENPFWRADSGHHWVPMRNRSGVPAENTEKTKVNAGDVFTLPISGRFGLFRQCPLLAWPLLCRFCGAFSVSTS
ncbi:uncharacterized protein LOC134759369 isoform X1 [Pongo abelii]|uniref:uncharacterized protein LOC134759369 isoform X1 n=1 Tax=Pongo abelii TaxID=9601 RepID=UPI003006CBFD